MAKKTIRLRYTGFILFASQLLSIATGVAFVLMITRNISAGEFGIWQNLGDVLGYFTLLTGIIPFWTIRFTARGYTGSAKTGLITNLLMSTLFASLYLALIPIIISALQISSNYTLLYVIASIQILESYTLFALQAVLRAKQPQMIGYGFIIFEICKVALGFTFIVHLKLGLIGVICSVITSYILQLALYIKLIVKELKERLHWAYLKEWIKASPINIYDLTGDKIATFTLIFLFVYGGELARAYHGAAATITGFIVYSSSLAFALYPRLLSESSIEDISISLKMVMMFAVPMTAGAIVLSDSYLIILDLAYAEARPILFLLAMKFLFMTSSQVFRTIVLGTERVDAKAKISFRELVKSRLFLLFTLPYIQSAITIPTTFFVLTSIAKTPLEAATYLALISLIGSSAMLIVKYKIAHKCLAFSFPWKSVLKYALASAVMILVLLVIPHPTRLLRTIALTLLGATTYIAVLMPMDKEARSLAKSILQEVVRIIKISKPKTNVNRNTPRL